MHVLLFYLEDEYGANFQTLEYPQKVDARNKSIVIIIYSLYLVYTAHRLSAFTRAKCIDCEVWCSRRNDQLRANWSTYG